jgi:integrase
MLTDTAIKAAIRNARADAVLNDGAQGKGGGSLRLKIRAGTRGTTATWTAWWQQDGKPATKTLGRYPELSLVDARRKAAETVASARNPADVAAATGDRTVARLFAGYVASMRQDGKGSAGEVALQLSRAEAALGPGTPASDVTAGDIADVLKPIHDRGSRVMADRMRAYLSAAFNWGIKATHDYRTKTRLNWGIKTNPAAQVRRDTAANTARERNLSAVELAALWGALDGDGFADGTGAAIRLLVCCGQRIRETMRVDGADIDLAAALWTMPARKTKGGKPHVLPLPAQAIAVFRELIEQHGRGPLFPARHGESERQLGTSLNKAMRRWTDANSHQAFQARDLRRTWKSRTADAGIDRFTRDLIQQHAKGGDTGSKHYDRADYLPQMRVAMSAWNEWLENNVVKKQQHKLAA